MDQHQRFRAHPATRLHSDALGDSGGIAAGEHQGYDGDCSAGENGTNAELLARVDARGVELMLPKAWRREKRR